jgi:hypothetical protein
MLASAACGMVIQIISELLSLGQERPTIMGPCAEHQNTRIKSTRITYIDSDIIHQSNHASNRTSNDIDFVPLTQYSIPPTRKAKEPPQPLPLPSFEPLYLANFNNHGTLNLPLNFAV